ncbi:uncharacterized protein LY89DRAFT_745355 [Mollisia scopiformis]|uniref:Uncharacterized protein n=1 Tax=Mollisia scopiformis TaxID=149040 RepID=A0A194XWG1_MOLSC|nr:uncharacterized protein LY89DRAFT_745355 [Mollisia scopiformis]KUJ24471.1 hypothetical protein LY89DRAFT_745355 [Mollisia scopiformis]
MRKKVIDVYDKENANSVLHSQHALIDVDSDETYALINVWSFYVGQGNWDCPRSPSMEEILFPEREPDVVVKHQTTEETPLLYRNGLPPAACAFPYTEIPGFSASPYKPVSPSFARANPERWTSDIYIKPGPGPQRRAWVDGRKQMVNPDPQHNSMSITFANGGQMMTYEQWAAMSPFEADRAGVSGQGPVGTLAVANVPVQVPRHTARQRSDDALMRRVETSVDSSKPPGPVSQELPLPTARPLIAAPRSFKTGKPDTPSGFKGDQTLDAALARLTMTPANASSRASVESGAIAQMPGPVHEFQLPQEDMPAQGISLSQMPGRVHAFQPPPQEGVPAQSFGMPQMPGPVHAMQPPSEQGVPAQDYGLQPQQQQAPSHPLQPSPLIRPQSTPSGIYASGTPRVAPQVQTFGASPVGTYVHAQQTQAAYTPGTPNVASRVQTLGAPLVRNPNQVCNNCDSVGHRYTSIALSHVESVEVRSTRVSEFLAVQPSNAKVPSYHSTQAINAMYYALQTYALD